MSSYTATPTLATFICAFTGEIAAFFAFDAGRLGWAITLFIAGVVLSPLFMRYEVDLDVD